MTTSMSRVPLREPTDVRAAREATFEAAWSVGCDATAATDAAVVASELATNALLHGRPPAWFSVRPLDNGQLVLEASDGSPATLDLEALAWPDADTPTGRGLLLCRELCVSVEAVALPDGGKVVRAVFAATTES